jgi:hypothetical protein
MAEKRNYWKEEEELLLKEWADKAQCYELLHNKSHIVYKRRHTWFVIPVIVISTVTGTANFAQDKITNESDKNIFVMVVGGFNIFAAIITTISQFLKVSEMNEGHRVASYSWGKYYRHIRTELAKHPLDRINPTDMLAMAKEEYDRLLELSPMIPKQVIQEFNKTFIKNNKISKPEICDVIIPTTVFNMTKEERLEMVLKINPPPPAPPVESETEEQPEIIIDEPEPPKPKINPMVEKFKLSFYKIHGRYPTEDEISASLGSLYKEDSENNNRASFIKNTFGYKESETSTSSSPREKEQIIQPEIKEAHQIIQMDSDTEDEN